VLVIALLGIIYIQDNRIESLKEDNNILGNNVYSYVNENSKLKDNIVGLKLTADQLSYFNDSIIQKLDSTRKVLKIKDAKIRELLYLSNNYGKVDTFIFTDTIFKDPTIRIDTIIGDKYYSSRLQLEYPNKIVTTPTFVSEKSIVVYDDVRYLVPLKKFFLARWLQKKEKQTVISIDVIEESPYVDEASKKTKYIHIIK
jgi:hypothetical protein